MQDDEDTQDFDERPSKSARKRDADAAHEFRAAIPVLMAATHENAGDDNATAAAGQAQTGLRYRRFAW